MILMMDNENKQIIKNSFSRKNILTMLYYYASLFFLILISSSYLSVETFRKDEIVLPFKFSLIYDNGPTLWEWTSGLQHDWNEKSIPYIFRWIKDPPPMIKEKSAYGSDDG